MLPTVDPNAFHVWNQFGIRVGEGRRDALRAYLSEHGVGSEIYYPVPMHQQQCFEYLKVDGSRLPETERASKEILNLPIFPIADRSGTASGRRHDQRLLSSRRSRRGRLGQKTAIRGEHSVQRKSDDFRPFTCLSTASNA